MVAVTVILAAVIGSFVLGVGDTAETRAPQTAFELSFDYDAGPSDAGCWDTHPTNDPEGVLTITHNGGENVENSNLYIEGKNSWPVTSAGTAGECRGPETFVSGSSTNILIDDNTTIRVVWRAEDSDDSYTLGTWSEDR